MEIERRVLIGFVAGRYPFISGASQPGEGDGAVWFIPESDHKAQLEQAIEEFAERLAGELERRAQDYLDENRRFGGTPDVIEVRDTRADTYDRAASLCRTLATEGRE